MTVCENHDRNMGQMEQFRVTISDVSKTMSLLQKDIEYLRRDQETILARFGKHVEDAEKEGGRHERLNNAENAIRQLQINQRWMTIGAGIIGGLIGSGAPEAVKGVARLLGV